MDTDRLTLIKKTAIKAVFSDDELFQMMVLKGGNALDLIYHLAGRSSLDLDFSLADDFPPGQLGRIRDNIERALADTFASEGLYPFDVDLKPRPAAISQEMANIWGGYLIEFKVIEKVKVKSLSFNIDSMRRQALVVGPGQKKIFRMDVSKHEYCLQRGTAQLDGYQIQVYTLPMILFEKLRAICQQMLEYAQSVTEPTRRARGRDFFDICTILEAHLFDPTSPENIELLKCIFDAKRVSLTFLGSISDYREYHRPDFKSLIDTLKPSVIPREFDYYFDYVVSFVSQLESLGVE